MKNNKGFASLWIIIVILLIVIVLGFVFLGGDSSSPSTVTSDSTPDTASAEDSATVSDNEKKAGDTMEEPSDESRSFDTDSDITQDELRNLLQDFQVALVSGDLEGVHTRGTQNIKSFYTQEVLNVFKDVDSEVDWARDMVIDKEDRTNDKITLNVTYKSGYAGVVIFVKEGNTWKIDYAD